MGRRRTMWPRPKGTVQFPMNGRQSIPLVGQGNTIRRFDLVRAFTPPMTIGQAEAEYAFELGMVRSDGKPIRVGFLMPLMCPIPEAVNRFGNALKHLQTYLNCECEMGKPPCVHHQPTAAPGPSILLTDAPEKTPDASN